MSNDKEITSRCSNCGHIGSAMFDWNNGTDFIVRIFVRSNVYKLTEKKDNVKIECFFLNLLEGSTWFSVTKPSHYSS